MLRNKDLRKQLAAVSRVALLTAGKQQGKIFEIILLIKINKVINYK